MTDRHSLSVPQADAIWDAIAIPGPRTPTFMEQYERTCKTVAQLLTERPMQTVQGRCPACSWQTLFLGDGGHVTCSRLECPDPSAADELLHGEHVTAATPLICSDERHSAKVADLERQLAALRTVARGYCPACGRGDAAPTVEDWEHERNERGRLEIANRALNSAALEALERAERTEAAITRVRALAGWAANGWSDISPDKILAALDQPTPTAATQATDHQEQPHA